MFSRRKLWLVAGTLAFSSAWAPGQVRYARGRYEMRAPGSSGQSVTTYFGGDFGLTSFGLGGLRRASPYAGGGALGGGLRSTIAWTNRYNINRPTGGVGGLGAPAGGGLSGLPAQVARSYAITLPGITALGAGPDYSQFTDTQLNKAPNALAYMAAMTPGRTVRAGQKKKITSFVPEEPGIYQNHVKTGDNWFRQRQYPKAHLSFTTAAALFEHIPESQLNLVHVYFAQRRYYSAAEHLRLALRYFPQLPLAQIDVRAFFSQSRVKELDEFDTLLNRLKERLKRRRSPRILMLLAYFQCFSGAEAAAAQSLRTAWEHTARMEGEDARTAAEAIQIFWDGMVAAGKVSGPLTTTRPAGEAGTTTRPAGPGREEPATRGKDDKADLSPPAPGG